MTSFYFSNFYYSYRFDMVDHISNKWKLKMELVSNSVGYIEDSFMGRYYKDACGSR